MSFFRFTMVLVVATPIACKSAPKQEDAGAPSSVQDEVARRIVLPPDSPMLEEIHVDAVASAQMPTVEVVAPGKLRADPNRLAKVELPVTGRITRILVSLGDAVTEGQTLMEVDSPEAGEFQSASLQARASVAEAAAALSKAEADRDRISDLFEHKAVARKEVLNAETALEQRRQELAQARAEAEQATARLKILGLSPGKVGKQFTLRAPLAGKVIEMKVAPGQFWSDVSAPLMTIADLSKVWVTSNVPEGDISKIRVGASLDVELSAYPDRSWQVTVLRIADEVDPQTHTVTVWGELENPDGLLRPEMFGRIRYVDAVAQLPVIPLDAVVQSESGPFVYRQVAQGTFEPVAVTLGVRRNQQVAVLSGLKEGDQIVVGGNMLLEGSGKTEP
ncbi:MAG: efflux RND transporter periplasmic adaptor subunit [Polyangiales bacterium]